MLNIVIPMAGHGSRFSKAGYTLPKPLIPLDTRPMIHWVIDNIRPAKEHHFIFICLQEHLAKYPNVAETLSTLCPGCTIIAIDKVTEGAACTVLKAKKLIDNDQELMIANSDQYVDLDINTYIANMADPSISGLIMTFWADQPKWSYCRIRPDGSVSKVIEKQVISNEATVGIYNFKHGHDFVRAAETMLKNNLRVNNEFYVAPVYNILIEEGQRIITMGTGKDFAGMYGLGTPEDFDFFRTTSTFRNNTALDYQDPLLDLKRMTTALTQSYATFFNQKNIAGIDILLHPEIQLEDPIVSLSGKKAILKYIADIFRSSNRLKFQTKNIFIDGDTSVIEFLLDLNEKKIIGTDIIRWQNNKIKTLRAYLYQKDAS